MTSSANLSFFFTSASSRSAFSARISASERFFFGPRFFPKAAIVPTLAAFLHSARCELYRPSSRSSAATSPGLVLALALATNFALYAAVNFRRLGLGLISLLAMLSVAVGILFVQFSPPH